MGIELRCAFSPELLGGKTGADAGPILIENYKRDKKEREKVGVSRPSMGERREAEDYSKVAI